MTPGTPPPPGPQPPMLTLAQQAAPYLAQGYYVKLQDRNMLVLEKPGGEVNHVLHLLLTVFTCGLWAIVWLVMAARRSSPKAITLYGVA